MRLVDISGAIITIDAKGTQKEIAAQIVNGKADYVLALKGNQGNLHEAVIEYIDRLVENDFEGLEVRQHTTQEIAHGREETRCYIQVRTPSDLPNKDQWKNLKTIGVAITACVRDGKESIERPYRSSSCARKVLFIRVVEDRPSFPLGSGFVVWAIVADADRPFG